MQLLRVAPSYYQVKATPQQGGSKMSRSKIVNVLMVFGAAALFSLLVARATVESTDVSAENISGGKGGTPGPVIVIQSYPADTIVIESVLSQ
jgi:hypothetical protein